MTPFLQAKTEQQGAHITLPHTSDSLNFKIITHEKPVINDCIRSKVLARTSSGRRRLTRADSTPDSYVNSASFLRDYAFFPVHQKEEVVVVVEAGFLVAVIVVVMVSGWERTALTAGRSFRR